MTIKLFIVILVLYLMCCYILIDIYFPLTLIIKANKKKEYYGPYDILANKWLTGVIKRRYIRKYERQIYVAGLTENHEWLKLNVEDLDNFFINYNVKELDEKFEILSICNRELKLDYELKFVLDMNRCKMCKAEKLIILNNDVSN